MSLFPKHPYGRAAVILTGLSVVVLTLFFLAVYMGRVNFDQGHWWDFVVAIAGPSEVLAFILSISAIRKEKALLTYVSLFIGLASVVFLLTHSFFLQD